MVFPAECGKILMIRILYLAPIFKNETEGKEKNIQVQVGSVTNTNAIHENVLSSAYQDPGAAELPDMFVSYPKTVLAMPDDTILVEYRDYFSQEELDTFIPAFLEEGTIHDRLIRQHLSLRRDRGIMIPMTLRRRIRRNVLRRCRPGSQRRL